MTKFGRSLTPGYNRFVVSSSSSDCNWSPDTWDSSRTDDNEACCSHFGRSKGICEFHDGSYVWSFPSRQSWQCLGDQRWCCFSVKHVLFKLLERFCFSETVSIRLAVKLSYDGPLEIHDLELCCAGVEVAAFSCPAREDVPVCLFETPYGCPAWEKVPGRVWGPEALRAPSQVESLIVRQEVHEAALQGTGCVVSEL